MAGPGKSTEQSTADDLIAGKHTPAAAADKPDLTAYTLPGMPKAGEHKGLTQVNGDGQAGGPANPDAGKATTTGDAAAAAAAAAPAAARATTDAAATPAAATTDSTAAAARATDATATTDATAAAKTSDASFATMRQVNDILDKTVPGLNKAHNLEEAKKAYEQAIALAKTIPQDELDKAARELAQVRKDKAAEQDPDKKRLLQDKENDLYSITRLKDAAMGNMALWYYRQGKVADGNEKLMEAAGIPADKARELKNLNPDQLKEFGTILMSKTDLPPICGDENFNKVLTSISGKGVAIPTVFNEIHQAVLQHNKDVAAAQAAATPEVAAAATPGATTSDAATGRMAADANGDLQLDAATTAAYNKVDADIAAMTTLTDKFKDKPAPIGDLSAADKKILEDGLKAYDLVNNLTYQALAAKQTALNALLPADKQEAYRKASEVVDADLQKIGAANNNQLPDALKTQISAVMQANTPDAFNAASAELAKTNPDLAKHITDAVAILGPDKATAFKIQQLYAANVELQAAYVDSASKQIAAHVEGASLLLRGKATPDDATKAAAKEMFSSGFKNVESSIANLALQDAKVQQMAKDVGIQGTPAAATGTDAAAAAPGSDAAAGSVQLSATANPNDLTQLKTADLQARLDAAIAKKGAGLEEAKKLFEEKIRRSEDPETIKAFNDQVKLNLTALETNKDPSTGAALTNDQRFALNTQNVQIVDALNTSARLHAQYAMYLGDDRLRKLDPDSSHAQLSDSLNQIKSMDAEQRKAIAAADAVDIDMMKRVVAQVNHDRDNNIGDRDALTSYKIGLEGGKGPDGQHLSLLEYRITLRDQLATLYLMQGAQFNEAGNSLNPMPKDHVTDELFRPADALKLLDEAKAANEVINGKGSHHAYTEQMYAVGQTLSPETFKTAADSLRASGANLTSDVIAGFSSVVGSTAFKFAVAGLARGKISPVAIDRMGDVSGIVVGVLARKGAHAAITGHDESWMDSIVHGAGAASVPLIFKYGGRAAQNIGAVDNAINYRFGNMTNDAVIGRVAGQIGDDATFAQVARVMKQGGLSREAAQLEALGAKTVASATPEELAALSKSMNLNGIRGAEAMRRMFPEMTSAGLDAKSIELLRARNINTVGDLAENLTASGARVSRLAAPMEAQGLKEMADSKPVTDALRQMKTGDGSKAMFASEQSLQAEAQFLKQNGVNTVGDLRVAMSKADDFFSMSKQFPELAGVDPSKTLAAAAAEGHGFGNAASLGRVQLKNILPETVTPDAAKLGLGGKIGSFVDGKASWVGDLLWGKRFYRVDFGRSVSFPNAGKPASELVAAESAGGIRGAVNRVTPSFRAPEMPNLARINPTTATEAQLTRALEQNAGWRSNLIALPAIGTYNTVTSVYDNTGREIKDAQGNYHKMSAWDAALFGNFGNPNDSLLNRTLTGTVGQALLGGFLMKGALPQVMATEAATAGAGTRFLSRIPAFRYGSEQIAGSGRAIKAMAGYSFLSPNLLQGGTDLYEANDKQNTVNNFNLPLKDYAPNNAGTVADQVREQQSAAPAAAADTTGTPAAAADTTAAPAAAADTTAAPAAATDATGAGNIDPNAGGSSTDPLLNQGPPR